MCPSSCTHPDYAILGYSRRYVDMPMNDNCLLMSASVDIIVCIGRVNARGFVNNIRSPDNVLLVCVGEGRE